MTTSTILEVLNCLLLPAYEVRWKVLFSQVSVHISGGYTHPADGAVPPSGWWGRVLPNWLTEAYPIQLTRGCTSLWPMRGTLIQPMGGTHIWLMGGYPHLANRGGYPHLPPLCQDWKGYPPARRQSSRASPCYMAGSTPLAFTQEDFLTLLSVILLNIFMPSSHSGQDPFKIILKLFSKLKEKHMMNLLKA